MKKTLLNFKHIVKHDPLTFFSCCVVFIWLVIALLPLIFPTLAEIPLELEHRLEGCSSTYWFGVDSNGRSIGLLLMNGARVSIAVSFCTILLSLCIGTPLGALAGFYGGRVDAFVSKIIDMILSFPPLILPIAVTAFFGGGFQHVVIALSLTGWVSYARLVRGQFVVFRNREFVTAARCVGSSSSRIIFKHIFPNTISPLVVQAACAMSGVVIAEAGLAFLGLGVDNGDAVSWGTLLSGGQDYLMTNPELAFFPGLALFSMIASLNFIGDALRTTLEPGNPASKQQGLL